MMTDILSTEDYELCSKLKAMRFSGMAEALEELLRDPNSDLIPFREKVGRLVDAEWDLRYNKKLNRFILRQELPGKRPGHLRLAAVQDREILQSQPAY